MVKFEIKVPFAFKRFLAGLPNTKYVTDKENNLVLVIVERDYEFWIESNGDNRLSVADIEKLQQAP